MEVKIARGNYAPLEDAGAAGENLLMEMISTLFSTNQGDGVVAEQATFLAALLDASSALWEPTGTNGVASTVIANLKAMLASPNISGGSYGPAVMAAGKALVAAAELWDDTSYYIKNDAGNWVPATALSVSNVSAIWTAAGDGTGYAKVEGYTEALSIDTNDGSIVTDIRKIDYGLTIAIASESSDGSGSKGVTINGSSSNDVISTTKAISGQSKATAKADVIYGNGGNDTISAGGGNDKIYGGAGNDKLNGQAGKDILCGARARTCSSSTRSLAQQISIRSMILRRRKI
jgi:Ca2+-binding RTX toxin-like protein